MAEAFGLAASILGVAELGVSVTQSLYRFTVSYRGADRQVEEIEGRVSVTATILRELHVTVKSNAQYFKRNPTGALEAPVSSCKRDYQRLKDAIDEVKGQPKDGAALTLDKGMAKMSAREKLKWALGGDESMDKLLTSLKSSKEDLGVLIDLLNYRLLIKAESRKGNAFTPAMAADLAELKRQLPVLVQLLQIRGLVPATTVSKEEQDDVGEKGPSSDRPRGLDDSTSPYEPDHSPEAGPNRRPEDEPEAEPEAEAESQFQDQGDAGGDYEDSLTDPPATPPLQSQPPITTSRIYEAYMFTGEVEKSYPIERVRISERELTELAAESQSSSALSGLALLPSGHRTAVNKLLEEREYEKGSIVRLIPIKGKKSWWRRLTTRRHKDRHPQVLILLQFEQDGERNEINLRSALPRRQVHYRVMQERSTEGETRAHSSERKELRPTGHGKKVPLETLPSEEEAEKLMDSYLAGFTTFSDDGDDGERSA